ncbi:MAG: cytochrome c oxidase subunit 4 [Corynebacteriales bacterium]|nr:cytochrome c oxidase subunit 4 [Mycobacteriales bacterium]
MKSESRIFNLVAVFLFITAAVYYIWTDNSDEGADWVGTTALILSGLLCAMCGMYFVFIARRIEPRPEDRADGEIHEGAGELGFFSPGSYWPLGVAAAASITGLGVAFWAPWLIITGGLAVLAATAGLLFEYYTGSRVEHH